MNRPLLMLSLPSSGTKWVANQIAMLDRISYYGREFFNPIVNAEEFVWMKEHFGCELPMCMWNMVRPLPRSIVKYSAERFAEFGFNFAKENFHFFHAEQLKEEFDIFFYKRSAENTFPPTRLRVYAWYDAMATVVDTHLDTDITKSSLYERAVETHSVWWLYGERIAKKNGFPIIYFEELMSNHSVVVNALRKVFSAEDSERIAEFVVATRKQTGNREGIAPEV